jgi:hypothetical protein
MDEKGLLKLKALMKIITLRRSNAVIELPARKDENHFLTFDSQERAAYERAKSSTVRMIEAAMASSSNAGSVYLNALQRINELRMICSQGPQFLSRPKKKTRGGYERRRRQPVAKSVEQLETLMSTSDQLCVRCLTDLEDTFTSAQLQSLVDSRPEVSGLPQRICRECFERGTLEPVSDTTISSSDCGSETPYSDSSTAFTPTKIRNLALLLKQSSEGEKRSYCR